MLTIKLNDVKLRLDKEVITLYKYNKLRGKNVEKYGTQERFAEAIGISENSLSKKMNGKTGISQSDMSLWGILLDIPVSEYGVYFFTQKV